MTFGFWAFSKKVILRIRLMGRSAGTFLTPDTDTVCSLIQPLCNTVYTSNKGLDELTIAQRENRVGSHDMLLVACSDDVVWGCGGAG